MLSNINYITCYHVTADFVIVQYRRMGIMVTHRDIHWGRILEEVRDT